MRLRAIGIYLATVGSLLSILVVLGITWVTSVRAQVPPPPTPYGPPGGAGGRPGGPFGPNAGGPAMFAGRQVIGSVTAVDPQAGTITVQGSFSNQQQVVSVSSDTQITSLVTTTVSQLQAGDQVQVRGIPTAILASNLIAGEPPAAFSGPPGFGPGGFGPRGFNPGGPNLGPPGQQDNEAVVTGHVFRTDPFTLALGNDTYLTIKLTPDAKITRYQDIGLSGINTGDSVRATGQMGSNGTFEATAVGVNLMPMGPGGPGFGRRGGFGPMPPGGGPPPPGGPSNQPPPPAQ